MQPPTVSFVTNLLSGDHFLCNVLLSNELYLSLSGLWRGAAYFECVVFREVAIGNVDERKLQRNYFVFEATTDEINLTIQNF